MTMLIGRRWFGAAVQADAIQKAGVEGRKRSTDPVTRSPAVGQDPPYLADDRATLGYRL